MTNRRQMLTNTAKGLGLVCGMGLTSAFSLQPMPKNFIPGHVESDDPTWELLSNLQLKTLRSGVEEAQFPPSLTRFAGATFTVNGFLLQLDARSRFNHFIVTRRNAVCGFCPLYGAGEAVEIFTPRQLSYTPHEYQITGRLDLFSNPATGLYYRLSNAVVTRL